MTKTTKILTILLISGLVFANLSLAQQDGFQAPENLEEIQEIGEQAYEKGKQELPGILERIWQQSVLPVWKKMYDWFMINVWPKIEGFFKREVRPRVEQEVEKRKPIIEEEFEKEKQEMKEELPKVSKSIWEKFKELWK